MGPSKSISPRQSARPTWRSRGGGRVAISFSSTSRSTSVDPQVRETCLDAEYQYGTPPSKSKGGKDAVKYKAETFETELAAAKKQNSTHQFQ
eukprot:1432723-Prymnesium_polylepis.1